ncbi:hypothetical protein [Paenirhodobacter populi]|uniref:hypothetical protein n=1 Tax=Paenirhodobacter populi TaxID=2306993 RepID=UPI0013E322C5|nr:hypothetical protein [Sinirhodobacter populi]
MSKPVFLLLSEAVGFGGLAECHAPIQPLLRPRPQGSNLSFADREKIAPESARRTGSQV